MKGSLQIAFAIGCCAALLLPSRAETAGFNRDIRPIFSDTCFNCHGPDQAARKGGLRLDKREAAIAAEHGHAAIVPGNGAASEVYKRISSTDPDKIMPRPETGKKLTPAQIALVKRWIDEGAKYEPHWAFVPPRRQGVPAETQNPIDAFIVAELKAHGLGLSAEADRRTLIRRLSFDLTGLPPSPSDVEAFLADASPDAYVKLVDRLLASPHYGERMAVEWLDAARYADTNGYQNDFDRQMWGWRDWVIDAFNRNLPFDRFTVEQIAGDLLPNATPDQIIATGFNRNNRSVTEAGSIEEEWLVEMLVDRVETTGAAFLGMTFGCARCHDHKYDPVTQKEFYQLVAFFNSTEDRGFYNEVRGNTGPTVDVASPEQVAKQKALENDVADAERQLKGLEARLQDDQKAWELNLPAAPVPEAPAVSFALAGDLGAGSLTNPVWGEALAGGKSLLLPGKPEVFVDAGQAFAFERTDKVSYGGWVKLDKQSGTYALLSKMDDAQQFRGFDIYVSKGQVAAHVIHAWPENALKLNSKQEIPAGVWTHLFVTYDGSSKPDGLRIYINGQPADTDTEANSLSETIATAQPLRLGKRSGSVPLAGELSDIRFYRDALTAEQVAALYSAPFIAIAHAPGGQRSGQQSAALAGYYREFVHEAYRPASKKLAGLKADLEALRKARATVMVMKESEKPRETYVLERGQYDHPDKTKKVEPDVPACFPPLPAGTPHNRLGLARWLVDSGNPLLARVTVNRFWAQCFGVGLVKSVENFGVQGDWPSHPELLDWLATEFVRTGWDVKGMMKLIVTSEAYRQASAAAPALRDRDPENRLLARGPRFRLAAEFIRDNALAVSGMLSPSIGGPSVRPYQPAGLWEEVSGNGLDNWTYRQDKGDKLYRRSMYTFWKRPVPPPTMTTFDAPSREVCRVKRSRTNTPLQALALLNDTTYVEAARQLAQKMMTEGGASPAERIRYGFLRATARPPSEKELGILGEGLAKHVETYTRDAEAAAKLIATGESKPDASLPVPELAAYTTVAGTILNLDETITKE